MLALSVTVAGAGYSFFAFSEDDSASESVGPSADNIRENFIFGDPAADSNVFDTKYYTVNFYAQYCGRDSVGDGPERHYNVTGGNSANGYSHYFGYFRGLDVDLINELGGTVTTLTDASGTFYNCITFRNISMITQEMVQAVGVPVCADEKDTGESDEGLVDSHEYLIHFLSWLLIHEGNESTSDVPNFYAGFNSNTSWTDASDGAYKCKVTGTYPFEGYEIPNFNLALENYDQYADENDVINFYPYLSTGKEYRSDYETKNAVAFRSNAPSSTYDLPSQDFVYDPAHNISENGIEAYRLPGLTVQTAPSGNPDDEPEFNYYTSTITLDINRKSLGHAWIGAKTELPLKGSSTYIDNSKGHDQAPGGVGGYSLSNLRLRAGRYNLYLFLKRSTYRSEWEWDTQDPSTVPGSAFTEGEKGEIESINETLKNTNIRQYKALELGYSFVYKQDSRWFGAQHNISAEIYNFYLVIEKSFDVKLLGGESGTLIYDDAPYSPSFNQIASQNGILDEFEVRDVTLDSSKTFEYDLAGYGKIIFPQTFFSIGIDQNMPRFELNTVQLHYDSAIGPGSKSTESENGDIDVPTVSAKYSSFDGSSVVTVERTEYYFSQSIGSDGAINYDWSLMRLSDWCKLNKETDSKSQEVRFIPEGETEAVGLADAYNDPDLAEIINEMPIYKVPTTGEYNFYLKFHYSPDAGVVESLQIDLYFYRIHNIFVKIASDSSWENGSGYVNTGSGDFTFYTSSQSYFLLDTLGLDDAFITNEGPMTLGAIMNQRQGTLSSDERGTTAWILYDVVSGQHALPTALENGEFVIKKNHVLAWKRVNWWDVGWSKTDDQLLAAYAQEGNDENGILDFKR